MEERKTKTPYIDFMAGIAILMIMMVHSPQMLFGINDKVLYLTRYGEMGCQCFFMLTGYKICMSYNNSGTKMGVFYLKRWLSIAPLYYVFICFNFFLTKIYNSSMLPEIYKGCWTQNTDMGAILKNVFFVHGVFTNGNNDVVGGGWYIGVTMIFYFLFPFLFAVYKYIYVRVSELCILIPIFAYIVLQYIKNIICIFDEKTLFNCGYFSSFEQLPCILFGMSLYYYFLEREKKSKKLCRILLWGTILLNTFNYNLRWINVQMLFTMLYVVLFVYLDYIWEQIDKNRIVLLVSKIGRVSYAFFFVHVIIFYEVIPVVYRFVEGKINVTLYWGISILVCLVPIYFISYVLTLYSNKVKQKVLRMAIARNK